jgi:branched-chain amino acid transport system permease protein
MSVRNVIEGASVARLLKLRERIALGGGLLAFAFGALFILLVCFVDYLSPSGEVVPPFIKHIIFLVLIYSILTLSLNFVSGFIGQVSFGHAAFFGFGAYASAILTLDYRWSFWTAFLAAGVISGMLGIPAGAPALRTKGNFLAVITYGFAEVVRFVALNLDITGGPSGLPGIPTPRLFKDFSSIGPTGKEAFIILAFLLAAFIAYFTSRVEQSRTGRAFAAIREDEIAALAMGININYYKLLAFVLGAVFAGFAGSLFAHYTRFVSPEILTSDQSVLILTMVIFGGPRSIKGSFVGATVLVLIPEVLHSLKDILGLPYDPWLICYGFILILMMRVRPQGLFGDRSIFAK